jgi:hypothetical protein
MKLPSGGDDRNKILAGVGGALVFAVILYLELRDPNPARPAAPPVPVVTQAAPAAARPGATAGAGPAGAGPAGAGPRVGGTAKVVATTAGALDPTLHMEAMLVTEAVEYEGSGRNIFSSTSAPVVEIAKPVAPARPEAKVAEVPRPVPCPPNCPQPAGPPPIPLKFFGVVTSAEGVRKAFLLHEDDVILAVQGDTVLRRYRVVTMSATSIQVEDMTSGNKQTLPLQVN